MTSRDLPYPLDRSVSIEEETPVSGVFDISDWPTIDPDEQVQLSMLITLNEFVKLASMVDVGRDIAYPNEQVNMWWLWLRVFQVGCMIDCVDVANCVETSSETQSAIANYLVASGYGNPNSLDPNSTTIGDRMPTSVQNSSVNGDLESCDLDVLWGAVLEIATRLDENARTLLENLIVINDIAQRYVGLVEAIPIIGDVAGSIAKEFTEVIPDIYNSFNAYSSTEHIEQLACEIFEQVCAECRYPTFAEVVNTVAASAFGDLLSWDSINLAVVIADFIEVTGFTPTLVWYSMLEFELFTLYAGASWNGLSGNAAIGMWAALGADNPSTDWQLLCEACASGVWCYAWDFTTSDGGWTVTTQPSDGDRGEYVASSGWHTKLNNDGSSAFQSVKIRDDFSSSVSFTRIEADFTYTKGTFWTTGLNAIAFTAGDGTALASTQESLISNGVQTIAYNVTSTRTAIQFQIWAGIVNNPASNPNGEATITAIRLYGDGTLPSGLSGGATC